MPAPELEFLAPQLERSAEMLTPAVRLFSSMVKNDSFDEFVTLPVLQLFTLMN
jgi:hypothetical protein